MEVDFVAHSFNVFDREGFIMHLDLLKTDYVWLMFIDDSLQLMQACAKTIDVKADNFHFYSLLLK